MNKINIDEIHKVKENQKEQKEQKNQENQKIKCIICKITEDEAILKNITFIKMSDIVSKKFNEEILLTISSIMPDDVSEYVCSKCIENTNKMIEKMMASDNLIEHKTLEDLNDEIDSFNDYITSSAHLLKLDHIIVIQSCFDTFMYGINALSKYNIKFSEHIMKTSIIELERKLTEMKNIESTGQ